MSFNVVSLFAGAGGSSLGYKMAGCNVLLAVEFLGYQAKTYKANNPGTFVLEKDVRNVTGSEILNAIKLKKYQLDILDGSPPCNSFSMSGKREKHWGLEKTYKNKKQISDDLFFEYVRILRELMPRVFVAENVKGLCMGNARGYFNIIYKKLVESGYNVRAKVLNAKYYGVPQSRERVIFIGVRNDINVDPMFPTPSNQVICTKDALHGIVNGKQDLKHTKLGPAQYSEAINLKMGESSKKYFNLSKQHPEKPCATITASAAGCGVIHWTNRRFTIHEIKALSSFPASYVLHGSYRRQVEACGFSVPPLMVKAIATTICSNILGKIDAKKSQKNGKKTGATTRRSTAKRRSRAPKRH